MPEGGAVTAVVVEAGALGEDFDIEVALPSAGASDGGQSVTVTLAKVTAEDGALATQAYLISTGELGRAACSGAPAASAGQAALAVITRAAHQGGRQLRRRRDRRG
jgi:hypothetical protein